MIKRVTDHISLVQPPNRARYPYCNCLLIEGRDTRALIDTSCGEENLRLLTGQGIDIIVNTHFHEDHILNNHRFPGAQIWAHQLDAPAIRSLETFAEYYDFNEQGAKEWATGFLKGLGLAPSPVHRELQGGEILEFGGVRLLVIFAPGHTPGHCCFFEEKTGILFSADIDLTGFGPWYGHGCSNLDDYIDSIVRCMDLKPNLVITSHRGIVAHNIPAVFQRYLDIIYRKEDMIKNLLITPQTIWQLVEKRPFYDDMIAMDPYVRVSEKLAIGHHLERLMKMGQVRKEGELYFLA